MVEDSEEEEDGTDADIRRWARVEAEHMEAEHAEEDADKEVREGLEGQVPDGYDEEEADREGRRRRGEGAGARRGPLFTYPDENLSMGG
jgi:ferric-dicitrate binding protein FerR (iron transport regulator)